MLNNSLKEIILSVAAGAKGTSLTTAEKDSILKYFDASTKTLAAEKAREAIEKTIGKKLPSRTLILEKAATSSYLDNLEQLLNLMDQEADKVDKQK